MEIREMRKCLGDTQREFAARYHIPFRTIQNWESGIRKPPAYMLDLLEDRVHSDLANKKTVTPSMYDSRKEDLPKRSDFIGAISWLKAVQECIADPFVFALDEALMCQGNFSGRSNEFIIWGYGNESISRFNGVVLLGNRISPYNIEEKNGLRYTDFNRTVADALANESILDMQGITEALSRYYYKNGESFAGVFVVPEYQDRFAALADAAVDYYVN
ncbi:MAG: helix-turn-helix domain-containing protein [Lachnospiraceae bacterium]|nr:helix-turn-helix domain-containing protein [Lachnospiraceae bacterium]